MPPQDLPRTSDASGIEQAVVALRAGRLVAFPTETVYGLGADAENAEAVGRIFAVKGRPPNHPLIVHIADARELSRWARTVPEQARRLAAAFWPGPLTIVLPKTARVPFETTGGLDTVALRVPAHSMALELLERFGGGLAAPSANRFGRVSPTSADHVVADLGADVEIVLDGGECGVGLESTIVDLTADAPVLLRPGGVTVEEIEALLQVPLSRRPAASARAPGMMVSHYAPRATVEVLEVHLIVERAVALVEAGARVAVLLLSASRQSLAGLPVDVLLLDGGADSREGAKRLYAALRQADAHNVDVILVSPPIAEGLGEALADRLGKAAAVKAGGPSQAGPE